MGSFRRNIIRRCRVAVHTLWEKGIRFRHPDYDPDRAQKLISSSKCRHLSTRNISSKSMHAFFSNLAHRQTNAGARAKTYTSSVVGGKKKAGLVIGDGVTVICIRGLFVRRVWFGWAVISKQQGEELQWSKTASQRQQEPIPRRNAVSVTLEFIKILIKSDDFFIFI